MLFSYQQHFIPCKHSLIRTLTVGKWLATTKK